MQQLPPLGMNESERIANLAGFDLDYTLLEDTFADLAKLVALITGASVSLINLIDSYTQWSISNHGLPLQQMTRESSVCQYTIMTGTDHFEVKDLSVDDRFKEMAYVKDDPNLRFYLGVPLQTEQGHNIGALCVLDTETKSISPDKIEMLRIIAREIVTRLKHINKINLLKTELKEAKEICHKVAHDVRGPLTGIIGVANLINEKGEENTLKEVLQVVDMFQKSSQSVLDLSEEILGPVLINNNQEKGSEDIFTLQLFKEKLDKLYQPQAFNKEIQLNISINLAVADTSIQKKKLLQIVGNLLSNAIKFTPQQGLVTVNMDLIENSFRIIIKDSGVGLDEVTIDHILNKKAGTTFGTNAEQGYGLGLPMVVGLINSLAGTLEIRSTLGAGTVITINLPHAQ